MSQEKEIIVGGQAVIEGVMMRAPNSYAVAVRRQDGSIVSKSERLPKLADKYPILKTPVLRGSAVLIHSMLLGVKALNFSATVAFEDQSAEEAKAQSAIQAAAASGALMTTAHVMESPMDVGQSQGRGADRDAVENPSKPELSKSAGGATATAVSSIAFALVFNALLFIALPLLLTNFLFIHFGWGGAPQASMDVGAASGAPWHYEIWAWLRFYMKPVRPSFAFNLVDGVIRMIFFIAMIFSFSRLKDIKRVFEYHGAEHKTVFAWEAGEELTVANARRHPRQHPRCGTSFLMVVMLVSVALFSVVKFDALTLNLLARIALIPLIAGVSFE
ncbi:MAG TPA: DUF1385 domain-containing protein, partial [Blastocatellia bacterium]